ncbi:hypothetical protein TNCV_3668751 [Trichonephila clavipes]|nr:hypothetical protein TNCV_3668751 [Trichonephila clavipes]
MSVCSRSAFDHVRVRLREDMPNVDCGLSQQCLYLSHADSSTSYWLGQIDVDRIQRTTTRQLKLVSIILRTGFTVAQRIQITPAVTLRDGNVRKLPVRRTPSRIQSLLESMPSGAAVIFQESIAFAVRSSGRERSRVYI